MYLIPKNACGTQIGTVFHELGSNPAARSPVRVWNENTCNYCPKNQDYDAVHQPGNIFSLHFILQEQEAVAGHHAFAYSDE